MRVVAVDWSGRAKSERRAIWLAEARDGELVRLEDGRSRDQVADHVLALAAADPELVVGFDFSFSLPAWFFEERGFTTVDELWGAAARDGERWLSDCDPPFWGRPGRPRPDLPSHLRVTEAAIASSGGVRPKSTFQVGGNGSVGTGSIRGWPVLARLRREGFAIWPFDHARVPLAVEVYPRACTGAVVKTDARQRAALLDQQFPSLDRGLRDFAVASDDAFDAAVTALVMAAHADGFTELAWPAERATRREGWVWMP
ncbi:MAG: DUF429 domain-containing protein [Acidimicrobiia bacterium]